MPAKSISLPMTPASHKRLSDRIKLSRVPAHELAAMSTLNVKTILRMQANQQDHQGLSIWAFVGIADAIKIDPRRLADEVTGNNAALTATRIAQARATVSRRQINQAAKDKAISVINSRGEGVSPADAVRDAGFKVNEPIKATVGEPEHPQATPIKIPSPIELMAKVKGLSDEDRWLVNEFIEEL